MIQRDSSFIYSWKIFLMITLLSLLSYQNEVNPVTSFSLMDNAFATNSGSPITIYRDSYSPTSEVHINIFAPDFNSNSYAIDTIGDEGNGQVTISTRESSIPYKLVETGPDTGIFSGYVILSGTTSSCSPVCGPTDGFLAAGGDDAISVSFTYGSQFLTYTSPGSSTNKVNTPAVPEFGNYASFIITISIIGIIGFSRKLFKS